MCKRTCPECKSTEHFEGFSMSGMYISCEGCGATLAFRPDPQCYPINMSDREAAAYLNSLLYVRPGAEACDPRDDAPFTRHFEPEEIG